MTHILIGIDRFVTRCVIKI